MPLYEYKCKTCEHESTQMHRIDDRRIPTSEPCVECGELSVEFVISTPMVVYSNAGSMKTTDSFNDRLKEIKKGIPPKYHDKLSNNIR